jgi:hypothetical protein
LGYVNWLLNHGKLTPEQVNLTIFEKNFQFISPIPFPQMANPLALRIVSSVFVLAFLFLFSCAEKAKVYKTYEGEIFGTYYRIQVADTGKDLQSEFDSVFALINKASNSYVQESEVTDFNNSMPRSQSSNVGQ